VVLAPSEMVSALASKSIAGYIVAEPFNAAAETAGVGKILRFSGDVWKNHACCVTFLAERDLNDKPEWSQRVTNAIVNAQLWSRSTRSRPPSCCPARRAPLHPAPAADTDEGAGRDRLRGLREARHHRPKAWQQRRIDFQPYPFASYTEELVRAIGQTKVEGDNGSWPLDPKFVATRPGRRPLRAQIDRRRGRSGRLRPAGQPAAQRNHRRVTMAARLFWPLAGFAIALVLWELGVAALQAGTPIAAAFSPVNTAHALAEMLAGPDIWRHVAVSLKRVAVALVCAVLAGVPLGILVGMSKRFAMAGTPLFQLLRMVSPLSWMPLAVMVLGVGDAPVYFLLAFAAVWPLMLATSAGVAQLDPNWMLLARSLSATRGEVVWRLVLPGITAQILTGVRLAIGIIWIVLVPAEMLGVSAGLGYFILDTRDRLAYSELTAAIILIGVLGFILDWLARAAHARWLHVAPEK
jgi:NitT/TauT family transport system permease protein